MKIAIASDHHGIKVKDNISKYLEKKGHEVIDYGTNTSDSVDYPEYAFKVGKDIKKEVVEMGILICGTGIGMSIAANKIKGVRCALVHNYKEAKLAKEHNHANCLAFSSSLSMFQIKDILDTFINTSFSTLERHQRRVDMLNQNK